MNKYVQIIPNNYIMSKERYSSFLYFSLLDNILCKIKNCKIHLFYTLIFFL